MCKNLRILVTRPAPKGQHLAEKLKSLANVDHVEVEPLFFYQNGIDLSRLEAIVQQYQEEQQPIFIFVSQQAVNTSFNQLACRHWPAHARYFAVGKGTEAALRKFGIDKVFTPPSEETSEGLLALPELNEVNGKKVLIIRGEGGRGLLKQALEHRGAGVKYAQIYKRAWHSFRDNYADKWQQQGINTVVLTSKEAMEKWVDVVNDKLEYWQQVTLVVASERIANSAKKLGFNNIIVSVGASHESVTAAIS